MREEVEQLVLAYDSDLAPIVGQQFTLRSGNSTSVKARALLLMQRAATPFTSARLGGTVTECDLVAHLPYRGPQVGLLFDPVSGTFQPDVAGILPIAPSALVSYVLGADVPLTATCVPPGAGHRRALDRDLDGAWDGDELAAGTDPADPTSF